MQHSAAKLCHSSSDIHLLLRVLALGNSRILAQVISLTGELIRTFRIPSGLHRPVSNKPALYVRSDGPASVQFRQQNEVAQKQINIAVALLARRAANAQFVVESIQDYRSEYL